MKNGRVLGALIAVLLALAAVRALAQEDSSAVPLGVADPSEIVAPVDAEHLQPEFRKDARGQGAFHAVVEPERQDLPPLSNPEPQDVEPEDLVSPPPDDSMFPEPQYGGVSLKNSGSGLAEPQDQAAARGQDPDTRRIQRQEHEKREFEERAFPGEKIPEGAYRKAWEEIQKMPVVEPPPPNVAPAATSEPSPQSGPSRPRAWLARLWHALAPARALALTVLQWLQIGPAPFTLDDGTKNAGAVVGVFPDPNSPRDSQGNLLRFYLGTYHGGLWKTTDGGTTWAALTDSQPSLEIRVAAVHPVNPDIVLAGTGGFETFEGSVGILRSVNGGSSWCRIGPACTDASHCPNPGPDLSDLTIGDIAIDNAKSVTRVWAATSKGLYYSDNAVSSSTFANCPAADGTCSGCSAVTWAPVINLPNRDDGIPEAVNHIFMSPWNKSSNATPTNTLFASVRNSTIAGNNGWYRSPDCACYNRLPACNTTCTWSPANSGFPAGQEPDPWHAAIVQNPAAGTDVLYSLMIGISTPQCGDSSTVRTRLYKGVFPSNTTNWTLVTAGKACLNGPPGPDCCTANSDCCDEGDCGCDTSTGKCSPLPDCDLDSVQVDPQDPSIVAIGGFRTWRSTNTAANFSFKGVGFRSLHVDHHGLAFDPDPTKHNVFFDGNDGGIWKTANFSATPVTTWSNFNGNLANIHFYRGGIDTLNYGVSVGGTQDNAVQKGGAPLVWSHLNFYGDAFGPTIIDHSNSNVAYFSSGNAIARTTDGGATGDQVVTDLPVDPNDTGTHPVLDQSLTMDPSANGGNKVLAIYSTAPAPPAGLGQKVYRTVNANSTDATSVHWQSVTGMPATLPAINALAIAPSQTPPSNIIFGAALGGNGAWWTTDAYNWAHSASGLPGRDLTSIAIDTSKPCAVTTGNNTNCTLYVSASGFSSATPSTPGHVFQSTTGGQIWQDISGVVESCVNGICSVTGLPCGANILCPPPLPDIPANKVVVNPASPNLLYLATDMGIFAGQAAPNPGKWYWGKAATFSPQAVRVVDLAVHPDSGIVRAFTRGRSTWEVQSFTPPNPDQKVDTDPAVTSVSSQQISSDNSGQHYGIGWIDNRAGDNNWHVQYRSYQYAGNLPAPVYSEQRVDDTSNHVAQAPSVSVLPVPLPGTTLAGCANVAWQDDRLDPINHVYHVFFNYICPGANGGPYWIPDQRADTSSAGAGSAAIGAQWHGATNGDFPIAWTSGGGIYARFFDIAGHPKAHQCGTPPNDNQECKVNFNAATANRPAVAVDGADNVFIAWEESSGATARIWISKYGPNGACMNGSAANCPVGSPSVELEQTLNGQPLDYVARSQVSLATDDAKKCSAGSKVNQICSVDTDCPGAQCVSRSNVVATWWEAPVFGQAKVIAKRCANDLSSCVFLEGCRKCLGGSRNELPCATDADCTGGGMCAIRASCPPSMPPGVQNGKPSSVATDVQPSVGAAADMLVTWAGGVNGPGASSAFGRSFNPTPGPLKNDFRLDLAGRAGVTAPRVGRGPSANRYALAWNDARTGQYHVYTRGLSAAP